MPCLDLILILVEIGGFGKGAEHIGAHHAAHHAVSVTAGTQPNRCKGLIRVHLAHAVPVLAVDLRLNVIGVLNDRRIVLHTALAAVQPALQALQIVRVDPREYTGEQAAHGHRVRIILFCLLVPVPILLAAGHHGGEIHTGGQDLHRVLRKRLPLHRGDIVIDAGGERQDQRNADDTDGTGKAGQQGAGLLGAQIVEAQRQRGEDGHGGAAHIPVLRGRLNRLIHLKGHGIRLDHTVLQVDDTGGILLRQLRVMGHHDHQAVFGHLLEQLHDLNTGLTVQRTGGLVGQQNIRVIHQRPGDGHPLHLAAGHLTGLFVALMSQSHLLQRSLGPAAALRLGHAGDGERQLHIGQHRLMRDQVIALEHKADGVVAVGIPVPVGVLPGGDTVDDEVAAVVPVKSADDVQQRCLARAAGSKNGHKLIIPQIQADGVQRGLHQFPCFVLFMDLF